VSLKILDPCKRKETWFVRADAFTVTVIFFPETKLSTAIANANLLAKGLLQQMWLCAYWRRRQQSQKLQHHPCFIRHNTDTATWSLIEKIVEVSNEATLESNLTDIGESGETFVTFSA
jgi:hypothetical protein